MPAARGVILANRLVLRPRRGRETFRQRAPQSSPKCCGRMLARSATHPRVRPGDASPLTAERTALNFLQALSGIATLRRIFAARRRITFSIPARPRRLPRLAVRVAMRRRHHHRRGSTRHPDQATQAAAGRHSHARSRAGECERLAARWKSEPRRADQVLATGRSRILLANFRPLPFAKP